MSPSAQGLAEVAAQGAQAIAARAGASGPSAGPEATEGGATDAAELRPIGAKVSQPP